MDGEKTYWTVLTVQRYTEYGTGVILSKTKIAWTHFCKAQQNDMTSTRDVNLKKA